MLTGQSAAALNRGVVQQLFDAVARDDLAATQALHAEDFVLELNYGHPAGGAFQGDEIGEAKARMVELLGLSGVELREIIAEGADRVVVLADAKGTDVAGEPWLIPGVELIVLRNGKIATTSLMLQGHARLLEIARGREGR
jgi:ketosteroid isomerase-like protein